MYLETGPIINQKIIETATTDVIEMPGISLPEMDCDIIPFYQVGVKRIFPLWVKVERVD